MCRVIGIKRVEITLTHYDVKSKLAATLLNTPKFSALFITHPITLSTFNKTNLHFSWNGVAILGKTARMDLPYEREWIMCTEHWQNEN